MRTCPISSRPLIVAAWRRSPQAFPVLWPIWLLAAVAEASWMATYRSMTFGRFPDGGDLPHRLLDYAATAAIWAVVGMLVLPVLMGLRARPWAFGAREGRYLALSFGLGVVFAATFEPVLLAEEAGPLDDPNVALALFFGCWAFSVWLSLRLLLWPLGVLAGDALLTFVAAWRAMAGAVWPAFAAQASLGLVPTLAGWFAYWEFQASGSPIALAATAVLLTGASAWSCAVAASVWRLRLGGGGEDLAAVFD